VHDAKKFLTIYAVSTSYANLELIGSDSFCPVLNGKL
jgi:hypothetical protein